MLIYIMAVHKDGHGFALDSWMRVVFNRVENAIEWCKDAKKNGLVQQVSEGWLPDKAIERPTWAQGLPVEDFDCYHFRPGTTAYEGP